MKLSLKKMTAVVYSGIFAMVMLGGGICSSYAQGDNSTEPAEFTFDQLLEMNEEELQSYSEEFSSIIEEINLSAVYYDCAVYTLNYYDISKYLDSDGLIQKDKLINDIGIPSELIICLSDVPETMTVNDVKCATVKLELSVEDYKDYKAYDVYRAFELILKTNSDIPFVSVEYSGKANSLSANERTVDLTFNQLLEMNEEELKNYSEEFSSIIEDINLSGVYYDCVVYTLSYYDISKYLDNDGLIQTDKLINDLGIPSELIIYLSDVPDTIIMNEVKCDTVKLELSVEDYKDYKAYDVYRAFELILKTNPDIPFVSVEYSGKANNISPIVADIIMGDVNDDGAFNVSDVVMLQKWILNVPDTNLANWSAANFCEDDRLDVFDLCLMKRALIEQESSVEQTLLECEGDRIGFSMEQGWYSTDYSNEITDKQLKDSPDILSRLEKVNEKAEQLKSAEMIDWNWGADDYGEDYLYLPYIDENGNADRILLCKFGGDCAWLDDTDVQMLVSLLIDNGYFADETLFGYYIKNQ